ncbi:MAG: galactosyldiacylglycerol synthase [Opitutaceae bacterium]|nr:galactosyldiacylglycerol synthase [Opitutaceae bacterium]
MSSRVLILSAGFGEGHNAAARALALAWRSLHGQDTARVADVFALAAPRANAFSRCSYLWLINHAPRLWSSIYAWLDRSTLAPRALRFFRAEQRKLAKLIEAEQPHAICCTYPVYAFWLQELARAGRLRVPFFNIVTDSISINSLWWRGGSAGWILPNEDSAEVLRRAGIDEARLHVLGFPVAPFFAARAPQLAPADLATGATPRVLYIVNSGTRHAAETARKLLASPRWEITCTVGRDEALRHELQQLARHRAPRTEILGWTDEMPRLLMTHHVVVSKAGGATTQEAIAARCPMIVNQIVPGQEEGNYELLRRHGIGALAETPDAVMTELQRAFDARGQVWHAWRAALEPLSRPRAAAEIAARVTKLSARLAEPIPVPPHNRPMRGQPDASLPPQDCSASGDVSST